jgi:hypothetical protein
MIVSFQREIEEARRRARRTIGAPIVIALETQIGVPLCESLRPG